MPVIHTHVSVPTSQEQRDSIAAAYGQAITAVPGKSESWLMCPFEDNMPIYFRGSASKAAYVEVNLFARSAVNPQAWQSLTEQICQILQRELQIDPDHVYVRYTGTSDWGWNGANF